MVNVKICVGTACYIMGGAELLNLADELSDIERQQVIIEGSNCLGLCKEKYNPATPYIIINDEVIEHATSETALDKIRKLLDSNGAENG